MTQEQLRSIGYQGVKDNTSLQNKFLTLAIILAVILLCFVGETNPDVQPKQSNSIEMDSTTNTFVPSNK